MRWCLGFFFHVVAYISKECLQITEMRGVEHSSIVIISLLDMRPLRLRWRLFESSITYFISSISNYFKICRIFKKTQKFSIHRSDELIVKLLIFNQKISNFITPTTFYTFLILNLRQITIYTIISQLRFMQGILLQMFSHGLKKKELFHKNSKIKNAYAKTKKSF